MHNWHIYHKLLPTGLHILDRSSTTQTLISAVGDLHNCMSLSALVSSNANGSRCAHFLVW